MSHQQELYRPGVTITGHHGSKAIIKQSSPCQATITMCINKTNHQQGLHHIIQGSISTIKQQPSLSKHHGSKAMIKQSSTCVSITKGYIIMGSTNQVQGIQSHHHHHQGSNHISRTTEDHHHPYPRLQSKSSIIRGSSKVITMTIMTIITIIHAYIIGRQQRTIIIQVASYCDHCKGHTSSSSDTRLPTFVVGIKDNLQSGVGINDQSTI